MTTDDTRIQLPDGQRDKILDHQKSAAPAADYFRAATLGGATALGRDDPGRLAAGALADLIVVDLSHLRSGPIDDPIRTINPSRPHV